MEKSIHDFYMWILISFIAVCLGFVVGILWTNEELRVAIWIMIMVFIIGPIVHFGSWIRSKWKKLWNKDNE